MDFYSLEEEDVGNIFVTQESRNIVAMSPNFNVEVDMEVEGTEMTQITNFCNTQYSDISDEEASQIQCSQVAGDDMHKG